MAVTLTPSGSLNTTLDNYFINVLSNTSSVNLGAVNLKFNVPGGVIVKDVNAGISTGVSFLQKDKNLYIALFTTSNWVVNTNNTILSITASGMATGSFTLDTDEDSYNEFASDSGDIFQNFDISMPILASNLTRVSDQLGVNSILSNESNLQLETNNTTRVFISGSGNVGIGTTSPTERLHVDGNLLVTGRLTAEEFHTEFVSASIIYQSGSTQFGNSSDDTHIFTGSLRVNGSITGSLFGTASWAQNALTSSFITPTGTNAFVQGGNSFGTTTLLGTNDNQNLQFETSGSVRVHIGNTGNVGIGTTAPISTLSVAFGNINIGNEYGIGGNYLGTYDPFIRYNHTGIAGTRSSSFGHGTAYMLSDAGGAFEANDISFYAGAFTQPEIMRIVGSTGFVGIGTSTPTNTLQVAGGITATSFTGSLFGTSSWAQNSLTASFALNVDGGFY